VHCSMHSILQTSVMNGSSEASTGLINSSVNISEAMHRYAFNTEVMALKRRRLISRLTVAMTFLLFSTASVSVTHAGPIDFRVVHFSAVPLASGDKYFAIRSPSEWTRLWRPGVNDPVQSPPSLLSNSRGDSGPSVPPNIDFDHFTLLVANSGGKPSGGYKTIFTSVTKSAQGTSVQVLEIAPGSCPRLTVLTSSFAYALIPKTKGSIKFIVSKAESDCNTPAEVFDEK
jgi:hypothetical protein